MADTDYQKYNKAIADAGLDRISIDKIAGAKFDRVNIDSTRVRSIAANMQDQLEVMGIQYAVGPSLECHLNFNDTTTYGGLHVILFRPSELKDIAAIDAKIDLGIALLTFDHKNSFPEKIPKTKNTIFIPYKPELTSFEEAVMLTYCAGEIFAKSWNNEIMMRLLKDYGNNYSNVIYSAIKR